MSETPCCFDGDVYFKASPEFMKECVNNWNRNIIFGKADAMFDNCDNCKRKSESGVDDIDVTTSVRCSPDPVEIANAYIKNASEDPAEYPKVFVGSIEGIPFYTFRPKGDKTRLEETLDNLKIEKAFEDLKKHREEVKKEEELMRYIVVLETMVDALVDTYFPTRDFIKMRKTLCPDWVDQLEQMDKKTDPTFN